MAGRLNVRHLQDQNRIETYSQRSYSQFPPTRYYQAPQWSVTSYPPPPPPPPPQRIATNPPPPHRITSNPPAPPPPPQRIASTPPAPPPQRIVTEPVVIGVMVLDINATPITRLDRLRSSGMVLNTNQTPNSATRLSASPGKVAYISGGVARNVADCMSKLKAKPFMISAVGHDWSGNLLWENWKSTGLSDHGILREKNIDTAVSCNTFDGNGKLAAAVASVESIEKFLTPEWIVKFKVKISTAPILMVDANLTPHSLEASCQMAAQFVIPVWFNPASVAKSIRIASVVHYVSFVSGNEDELIVMANALYGRDIFSPIRRDDSSTVDSLFELLKPAIQVLLYKGVKVIIVTIGSHGAFLCSKSKSDLDGLDFKGKRPPSLSKQLCDAVDEKWLTGKFHGPSRYNLSSDFYAVHFPALPGSVVRVTGAGDCLVGGTIASLCAGLDVMQSVSVGIAAAKFAIEVETNVPAEQSLGRIAYDAMYVYSGMSVNQNNTTKNPSLIESTSNQITRHLATSQPPPQQLQSQSQNPTIGVHDPLIRGSANNYQISPGHAHQIDEQMTVRGQQYQQPINTSVQQKKDAEEKPKYAEILMKNNIRNEAKQEDKHEEGKVENKEEEEEDASWLWKAVKSKKEKKRTVKEANQRAAANGKNKNKHTKY
ncbi:hypothetical protein K7X08_019977 [Anisodus acutangulus]|uniref:Carbohydrate kinase PfkB domain-containing protein n=1 Tax=Anisodus acutangulus TaxID=402998 RepID=A0A9Q1MTK1_9SOLA|nr:hypothetical protein K7X08_019977 [Anisodus acutangulus]